MKPMQKTFGIAAAVAVALAAAGCDVNEGPREESNEVVRSIERVDSPEEVADQMEDVAQADRNQTTAALDKQLDDTEKWGRREAQGAEPAGPEAKQETKDELDKIDAQIADLRDRVKKVDPQSDWEAFKADFNKSMKDIAVSIDKLDGEVDDKPGDDPMGPG
ncbi:MAG: hypothetical protein R3F59_07000 [Myxococcota bacterium]